MAGVSLLALLDDITALLDDVALMTKTAASKTAGVLGDDLAVNAEQVTGVNADRELPVVWAVAKGSMINKCIIVPIAMLLSFFVPSLILPILMLGGLYLCFEGAEKVFSHHVSKPVQTNTIMSAEQVIAFEKDKVKGAIRTDFVLSIEIIVITLGTVTSSSLITQFGVLALIAIVATVGVYGIVALIVKLDDMGLYLLTKSKSGIAGKFNHQIGFALVNSAPYLMKLLTVVGTLAMFLVGGGILSHSIHVLSEYIDHLNQVILSTISSIDWLGKLSEHLMPLIFNGILGLLSGGLILLIIGIIKRAK